ncbi:hypothetical protein TNCV_3091231 [Trichonephila clavipes]|uniref:Uncharacterized protein n=1 Tax=Trichonephila clavipes TaxID=2585209 RepID=A0A8X6W9G1_TRICX|nr:hypothetical protein TNCV_3091231 [Trichonephila clavipes]
MRLSVQLEKIVELATTVLVMSSHTPLLSIGSVSPSSISSVRSSTSLSEHMQLHSAGKMSNQHQVSFEEICHETFQILTKAYGYETLSSAHVFEWHVLRGKVVIVEDDEPAEHPRSAITDHSHQWSDC